MKTNHSSKKSFTIFEIVIVLIILSIIISISIFTPKKSHTNIDLAIAQLKMHLNLTRKIAMQDDIYNPQNPLWYRQRWTLKFRNCAHKSGIYYIIYSDKNGKGHPSKKESIKDPLTHKYLYSHYDCNPTQDESKYILLSKTYAIDEVKISCNHTNSIGQISFGNDGTPYYKLSTKPNQAYKYELKRQCSIILKAKNQMRKLIIEPVTGYIF